MLRAKSYYFKNLSASLQRFSRVMFLEVKQDDVSNKKDKIESFIRKLKLLIQSPINFLKLIGTKSINNFMEDLVEIVVNKELE